MHARFNNAGSSMRSQRVVSFLTSTGRSPLPVPLSLSRRFILHASSAVHTSALCIGYAQASAHLRGHSVFPRSADVRNIFQGARGAYSYGNPRAVAASSRERATRRLRCRNFHTCRVSKEKEASPAGIFRAAWRRWDYSVRSVHFPQGSVLLMPPLPLFFVIDLLKVGKIVAAARSSSRVGR